MISIAIVEDDNQEATQLESFINKYAESQNKDVKITFFKDAVKLLDNYSPVYDIIFMDIEMPYLNGMEAAEKLRRIDNVVTLIFVTNMSKYAIKGYEVNALDFMIKPIRYAAFKMKFKKAVERLSSNEAVNIVVFRRTGLVRLTSRQIIYVEVIGHKLHYHLSDEVVEGTGSLTELENQLQKCNFLRCHSSYLINPQYISNIQGYNITMTNGDILRISRPRKKEIMQQLAEILGEGRDMQL